MIILDITFCYAVKTTNLNKRNYVKAITILKNGTKKCEKGE